MGRELPLPQITDYCILARCIIAEGTANSDQNILRTTGRAANFSPCFSKCFIPDVASASITSPAHTFGDTGGAPSLTHRRVKSVVSKGLESRRSHGRLPRWLHCFLALASERLGTGWQGSSDSSHLETRFNPRSHMWCCISIISSDLDFRCMP